MPEEQALPLEKVIRITQRFNLGRTIVRSAATVLGLFVGIALPIKWGAGRDTTIDYLFAFRVILETALDARLEVILPWAISALLFFLWFREQRTSKRAIHREHTRLVLLEEGIDEGRTSSNLVEVPEKQLLPAQATSSSIDLEAFRNEIRASFARLEERLTDLERKGG